MCVCALFVSLCALTARALVRLSMWWLRVVFEVCLCVVFVCMCMSSLWAFPPGVPRAFHELLLFGCLRFALCVLCVLFARVHVCVSCVFVFVMCAFMFCYCAC